jgi:hypothetical protein
MIVQGRGSLMVASTWTQCFRGIAILVPLTPALMKALSTSEAIWPALERTYSYLFRPFQWETFLKLAAVATLSEGFLVSFRFAVPNAFPFDINATALRAFVF